MLLGKGERGWDAQVFKPQSLKASELLAPKPPSRLYFHVVVMNGLSCSADITKLRQPNLQGLQNMLHYGCARAMACKNTSGSLKLRFAATPLGPVGLLELAARHSSGLSQSGSIFHPLASVWSRGKSWAAKVVNCPES